MSKKKIIIIFTIIVLLITIALTAFILLNRSQNSGEIIANEEPKLKELPLPEITGGARGELGIDKNINESNIDEYLNRPDSVYRDMRMLEDPGNYEAIGGDRYLSGYIKGFEVIPLPYIMPVTGLPNEVGDTYTGTTLFYNNNGTYVANYKESMDIIEKVFPKDKVIFLMCGGGGYAGMTKNFLVSLGWDETKIYNVGGYWYYKGENGIDVKKVENGIATYDFENVPYHDIEFEKLTKSSDYKDPVVKVSELKISTSKLELEEETSFKLNVIVLPNEATNKELKWESSNKKIATVDESGLVKAVGNGNVTITATSIDGDKTISCEVIVNKKKVGEQIELDDVSKEANELAEYDINKITQKFYDEVEYPDGTPKEEYSIYTENGGTLVNDLWREKYAKYEEERDEAIRTRIKLFNKLIDSKKSFIVIISDTECETTYDVAEHAEKILNKKNYSYVIVSTPAGGGNGDETFFGSKLDIDDYKGGAIAIIKEGKLHASTDPDVDSLKSEKDIINWLSKYIDIK